MVRSTSGTAATPDGRDTRWDDHRAARHERILDAAIQAIDADGGAIGVAAIADRASIPRSVVYRLFETRDDLDEQIRKRIVDDLMSELAPALDPRGTVKEAIRRATATYVGWVAQHPHLQQFLGTGSATRRRTGSRVVTGTRTAIALNLTHLLDREMGELRGDIPLLGASQNVAFGIVGLVDGAVNRWVAQPTSRSSAADLVDFLSEAVWSVLSSHAERVGVPLAPDQPLLSDSSRTRHDPPA